MIQLDCLQLAFPGCCCVCLTGFAVVCTTRLVVDLGGGRMAFWFRGVALRME